MGVCDGDGVGKLEDAMEEIHESKAYRKSSLWNATWVYDEGGQVVVDESSIDLDKPWGRPIITINNDSINTGNSDHCHMVDGRWMFVPGTGKQDDDDEDVSKPWGEKLHSSGEIADSSHSDDDNVVDGEWMFGDGDDGMEEFNDWIDESKMLDMFQAVLESEAPVASDEPEEEPEEAPRPRNRRTYSIKGEIVIPAYSGHSALTESTAETTEDKNGNNEVEIQQHAESTAVEPEHETARRSYYKIIREIDVPKGSDHSSTLTEEGVPPPIDDDVKDDPTEHIASEAVAVMKDVVSEDVPEPALSDRKQEDPPPVSETASAEVETHAPFISIPVTTRVPSERRSRPVRSSRCTMMDLLNPPPRIYFK